MMQIRKIIAQKELEVIGGNPQVFHYWDDNEINNIDIMSSSDRPYHGVKSYATIGLSECDIGLFSNDKRLRVELLGACDEKEYAIINGWEALEDKFEAVDIDIFNLNRKSII